MYYNSIVEINKKALLSNLSYIVKNVSKKTQLMYVVKANAYGHGLKEIISILKDEKKIGYFATFLTEDAFFIRKKTIKPILILSNTRSVYWEKISKHSISITISNFETLYEFIRYKKNKKIQFHIKVDTGLGRQGFLVKDIDTVLDLLSSNNLIPEGLYSHFAGVEEKKFDVYSTIQYEKILLWKKAFADKNMYPKVHIAATAGTFRFSPYNLDIVRIGLGAYGLWPSIDTKESQSTIYLKPVLTWKTYVSEIKELPKGSPIAYDLTHILKRKTTLAIIPVGYFDGLPRTLSNKGYVLIQGKKAFILGRVMMNMCVVDITDISFVNIGDEVTLLGQSQNELLPAEQLALLAGTINYEIVTNINPLTKRVIVPLQKNKK